MLSQIPGDPSMVSAIANGYEGAIENLENAMKNLNRTGGEAIIGHAGEALHFQVERLSQEIRTATSHISVFASALKDYSDVMREAKAESERALQGSEQTQADYNNANRMVDYYRNEVMHGPADEIETNIEKRNRWEDIAESLEAEIDVIQVTLTGLHQEVEDAAVKALRQIQAVTTWNPLEIIDGIVGLSWGLLCQGVDIGIEKFQQWARDFEDILTWITDFLGKPEVMLALLALAVIFPGVGPAILLAVAIVNFGATLALFSINKKDGLDLLVAGAGLVLSAVGFGIASKFGRMAPKAVPKPEPVPILFRPIGHSSGMNEAVDLAAGYGFSFVFEAAAGLGKRADTLEIAMKYAKPLAFGLPANAFVLGELVVEAFSNGGFLGEVEGPRASADVYTEIPASLLPQSTGLTSNTFQLTACQVV